VRPLAGRARAAGPVFHAAHGGGLSIRAQQHEASCEQKLSRLALSKLYLPMSSPFIE